MFRTFVAFLVLSFGLNTIASSGKLSYFINFKNSNNEAKALKVAYVEGAHFYNTDYIKFYDCLSENNCEMVKSFPVSRLEDSEDSFNSDHSWFRLTWEKVSGATVGGAMGAILGIMLSAGGGAPGVTKSKMNRIAVISIAIFGVFTTAGYQIGNLLDGKEFNLLEKQALRAVFVNSQILHHHTLDESSVASIQLNYSRAEFQNFLDVAEKALN